MSNPIRSRSPRQESLLACALEYLRWQWCVIPIAIDTKQVPKNVAWRQFQTRLPTEQELRDWFADRGDRGLAVIGGSVSGGLVCRDFDAPCEYEAWRRAHADLAARLPTVRTGRGFHVYFRASPEFLVFRDLAPVAKGEYRGDNKHYSVLPPSAHPNGNAYEWVVEVPEGRLPLIDDVCAVGLLPPTHETQKAQGTLKNSPVMREAAGQVANALSTSLSEPQQIFIEEAISRTLPKRPGERRRKLFDLARRLKFSQEFSGVTSTSIEHLRPMVRRWWEAAMPFTSGTHAHFGESWKDFVFAWEEARVPYGATFRRLFDQARYRESPQKAINLYGKDTQRSLLVLLRYLILDRFVSRG